MKRKSTEEDLFIVALYDKLNVEKNDTVIKIKSRKCIKMQVYFTIEKNHGEICQKK